MIDAPTAEEIAAELRTCEPGELVAMALPHQDQADRRAAIQHHSAIVAHLRARGWRIRTALRHYPDGDLLTIEVIAAPET